MKKKTHGKHNRDGSKDNAGQPKQSAPVDKDAIAFKARRNLESSLGSGKLSRQHPSPWTWHNGVLRDAKQCPIPGARRIQAER